MSQAFFVGARLKLARERARLSLRNLSARLNGQVKVSPQALGKYERGEIIEPSLPVLIALSKVLDVPTDYFMTPLQVRLGDIDFRKRADTSAKDRMGITAEVLQCVERCLLILRKFSR